MKTYHLIRLYQVTETKGYIQSGEMHTPMVVIRTKGDNYKIEAAYSIEDTNKIILVEKLNKFLVREIKTGIVFPIVNIKTKTTSKGTHEYLYCLFDKVHTFVCSRDNKLLSKEINSSKELEGYDKLHLDAKAFKEELLEIIEIGKNNCASKLNEEKQSKKEQKEAKQREKELKRNEKIKVRRLKRQFKQERKTN